MHTIARDQWLLENLNPGLRVNTTASGAIIRVDPIKLLVFEPQQELEVDERDYGDLVGMNKDDARKKWGEEQVHIWRRSYDVPPPGGESLKDTVARALPYFVQEILPHVLRGERVLISAHGNSLRALIMVLERLTPERILKRELGTGVPIVYRLNADSTVASQLDLAA